MPSRPQRFLPADSAGRALASRRVLGLALLGPSCWPSSMGSHNVTVVRLGSLLGAAAEIVMAHGSAGRHRYPGPLPESIETRESAQPRRALVPFEDLPQQPRF